MFVRHIDFFHKPTVLQYLYNHTLIWYYIETIVGYSDCVAIETIHFFLHFKCTTYASVFIKISIKPKKKNVIIIL